MVTPMYLLEKDIGVWYVGQEWVRTVGVCDCPKEGDVQTYFFVHSSSFRVSRGDTLKVSVSWVRMYKRFSCVVFTLLVRV